MSEGANESAPESAKQTAKQGAPMIRTALVVGPVLACVGIAWTAIAPSSASSAAILVGLITAIAATHRFGRLGQSTSAIDAP